MSTAVDTLDSRTNRSTGRRRALLVAAVVVLSAAVLVAVVPAGPVAIVQAIADGVRVGLILALVGIGLSLVFATTGVFNFAHGELATLGALTTWALNAAGVPLVLAMALVIPVGIAAGYVGEKAVWRPLRRRGVSLPGMLVVGIGLGLALRSSFLFAIGGGARTYREGSVQAPMDVFGVSIQPKQIAAVAVVLLVLAALALFLRFAPLGQAIRAVSDDRELAAATGVAVDRVLAAVWMIGGALATLGGALMGLFEQVSWQMGNQVLLLVIAGVTLGGLGSVAGAAVGGVIVGVVTQLSVLVLPAELKYVTALVLLILILLIRPSGLFGRRQRIG
ncbi:branched-chain amino acid ABC transporter permease [Microbacterium ulmi]|uniref:Branched-chain amino acid ABC transporter permease n=1 Tax=Microbacterium ulmi TaxID=179095 RepID=A0A7Y2LYE8_9MICO|nr:branched-chain amino acid ABC transporter permease [Microbacterium ulmi]NII68427.1 branched-chain amino acid transport system permease protein [Microbacterium ulmi]NNH03050.1 branched-chain amino acid ABC transporter permease [Microbacterium ulmi]